MLELDAISRRYGKLPSEICNRDIKDYNLDLLIASIAFEHETKVAKKKSPSKRPVRKVAYRRK